MSQPTRRNPHDYANARRDAEHRRGEALDELWRGADTVLDRICLNASARLARSTRRLQARLVSLRARRAA